MKSGDFTAPNVAPGGSARSSDSSDAESCATPAPASDLLDSFNEDLVWIVDRLVTRSGGSFGIVSRHIQGDDIATVLARTTQVPTQRESFFLSLASAATPAISNDRRRHDDVPCMVQAPWTADALTESGTDFRILHLAFAPTQNVSLVATVCRQGSATPFNEVELLTAAKLYPVLSRYVRLWWLHRMERRRASSLSAALDLSDVGVMLLDRSSDLVFANSRATMLLDRQDGLRRRERSIVATDGRDGFKFQAAIQHALYRNLALTESDEDARSVPILPLQRDSQRRALIVAVMNVERRAVDLRDPAVVLYVFDPEQDVEQMLAPVCVIYKLTGTEARLVQHLVSGLRIIEAAERMQVQPDTARAYLKQVFLKTRTNRQVDLVRLMLASMLRTSATTDPVVLSAFD